MSATVGFLTTSSLEFETSARRKNPSGLDPMVPARGIILGALIGAGVWTALLAGVLFFAYA